MRTDTPCHNCPSRFTACHDVCIKRLAWLLARDMERADRDREKQANEVAIRSCQRCKEHERKHRRR